MSLVAALLLLAGSTGATRPVQQSDAQAPPPRWERSHDYDVLHYRIALSFDWDQRAVIGETTITLAPFVDGLREVALDAEDMEISSARLVNGPPLTVAHEGRSLRVSLDRAYRAAETLGITLAYRAVPRRGMAFITPNESDPNRPYQIWTAGQSEDNHHWFPCYDYPNDRATSETIVTVDERFQVISNGALVGTTRDPVRRTTTYHWKLEQRVPSYLISLVVGEFERVGETVDGVDVASYVQRSRAADARVSLAKLPDMFRFFSAKLGKYPYSKYAQIAVRDFPGALENVTATVMSDTLVHDARAHLDLSSDETTAHELAHQWFGDHVTCRTWTDLWLNEGFATYLSRLYEEHDRGRETMLYGVRSDQRSSLETWARGDRRPIATNRYGDPDSLFDTYAYARASSVLHMLRVHLGDEAWWKAVRYYLERHADGSVETSDLEAAIQESTGVAVDWFFDQWISRMGHPELDVSYTYDDAARAIRLRVRQTQKPDANAEYPVASLFRLPVDVAVTSASGERIHRVVVNAAEQEFTIEADARPLIVNFDRGGTLLKALTFRKPKAELAYQAEHDSDPIGRIWAIDQLAAEKDDETARALGRFAARDPFWGVRVEATRALAGFRTAAAKRELLAVLQDRESSVRREAVKGLSAFADASLAPTFASLLERDPSYFVAGDAARALAETGAPIAYDALVRAMERTSEREVIRASALEGLGMLKDPRVLNVALRYAEPPYAEAVRVAAIAIALPYVAGGGAPRDRLFRVLTSALKSGGARLRFTAVAGLSQLGDPRAVPDLEAAAAAGLPGGGGADTYFRQFARRVADSLRTAP